MITRGSKGSTYHKVKASLLQSFLFQILRGVAYCHSQSILHRDLKPGNLLIDLKSQTVKIADFGLAREFVIPLKAYTKDVATLGYRAPEIWLGSTYSSPVDVWAVGRVFAEMVNQNPLFNGFCDEDVLISIFSMLGVPNEASWPGVTGIYEFISKMPLFPTSIKRSLADVVTGLEPAGIDLLSTVLLLGTSFWLLRSTPHVFSHRLKSWLSFNHTLGRFLHTIVFTRMTNV